MSSDHFQSVAQFRRRAPRHSLQLKGRFHCDGMSEWLECTVVDISGMGARLELPRLMIVPRPIRFQVPPHLFAAKAIVRHQNGRQIGVEFVSSRREALAMYG